MPTFTAIALESLLEPGSRNPNPNSKPPPPPARLSLNPPSEKKKIPLRPPHAVSPILYATPEVTPLPDSPSSFPPSPYIINHKRRGPRLVKSSSQIDVFCESLPSDLDPKNGNEGELKNVENEVQENCNEEKLENGVVGNGNCEESNLGNGDVGMEEMEGSLNVQVERKGEFDDFLDFQDSMSTKSNTHADDRLSTPSTPIGEYYDAFEEISSDGTTRLSQRNVEDELREMRLNILMEIEKRKQAEEALENLQNQWLILTQKLAAIGLILPPLQSLACDSGEQPNIDPAEELCRQVVITRAVADSVARGCARAEVELEMEPQIEAKNFEITRLWDRLQYYEAANREMSQRNQEAVEMARQQRYRKKRKQRWVWGSIGLAVTLGAAAIAYSYVPASKPASSSSSSHEAQQHNQQ